MRQMIQDTYEPALVCTSCFHPADTALYTIGCRRPDIHKSGYYSAVINKGILVLLVDNVHQSGLIYNYPPVSLSVFVFACLVYLLWALVVIKYTIGYKNLVSVLIL